MKFFYFSMILVVSLFMASCGSTSNNKCSKDNTNGPCDDDKVCNAGVCEAKGEPCSAQAPEGYCEKEEYVCKSGTCVDARPCSIDAPAGICEDSNKFCDTGVCKDKLSKYKLGAITQTLLKEDGKPYELLNEFHFEVMDVTGRNKRRITNDIQSCINKDSCWPSDNYNYFLYLKDVGEGVYSLNIVDVPEDFNTDFTQSELVTTKLIREPVFLKDGKHFIYIENISQTNVVDLRIKKYNMETKTASEIAKFALEREVQNQDGEMVTVNIPANNFLISEDNSILVFDFEEGYNSPVEIFSLDLNNPTNPPVLFYKYVRQNSSGSGLNVGAISSDNKKLAFITDHDLQHRLHIAHLDTSDLIIEQDPKEDEPLGKFVGPLQNACATIQGTQFCEIKSKLHFTTDDKFLYFAGRVDGGTELSKLVNIYKFDIEADTLIKVTNENIEGYNLKSPDQTGYVRTSFQDLPIQSIIFNMDTENAVYTMASPGLVKNHDVHYINLNSTEKEMGIQSLIQTREGKEVKLFMLQK